MKNVKLVKNFFDGKIVVIGKTVTTIESPIDVLVNWCFDNKCGKSHTDFCGEVYQIVYSGLHSILNNKNNCFEANLFLLKYNHIIKKGGYSLEFVME